MDLDDDELQATRILNGTDTREHKVYAIKFAVMQKQIDEKDKRIQELEQKQSILDKVTDKLKEDIEINNFKETLCLEDKGRYYYGKELLNIIEGENNGK